jgi:hypothetical protein
MKELSEWWSDIGGAERKWLLLGKGPSFAKRTRYDLTPFFTVALNHVVREMPVDVASAIDIEVVRDCAEDIRRNARFLLMPRYPHIHPNGDEKSLTGPPLESFFDDLPVLRELDAQGRLVWYNLDTGENLPGSPQIRSGQFSAEVIVNLLGVMEGRSVRTLGVDGGTRYAAQFDDLAERTRLSNGQQSFDVQFEGIRAAVRRYGIDYRLLDNEGPVRIFVGTDQTQLLGARVLEYSVRKHCSRDVIFDTMLHVRHAMPADPSNQPRTNFSFNRFAIPGLAGFQGRAVYVDADMLVFRDFCEVWDLPFEGAKILYAPSSDPSRPKQFSVLLMDCEALDWDLDAIVRGLDAGRYGYDGLMKEMCIESPEAIRPGIPPEWNSLEEYVPGKTGLIHYTDMPTQPWVSRYNKHGRVWVDYLREAIADGFISVDEVRQAVRQGYARPSLLWQLKVPNPRWPKLNGVINRVLDRGFQGHGQLQRRLKAGA